MSHSSSGAKETANSVLLQPEAADESGYDKKHQETSGIPSLCSTAELDTLAAPAATDDVPSKTHTTPVSTASASTSAEYPPTVGVDEKQSPSSEEKDLSRTEAPTDQDAQPVDASAKEASDAEDGEIVYPGGVQLGLLTFGLCMATFTVALDNTIIATAIPKITTVFDSLGDVGWYGSSYLLTTTALQPSFGRIYTYFNVKYTYLFALCLFEFGSIICAAARNSVMLIVGRAVAGAGASALFSGGELSPHAAVTKVLTKFQRNDDCRLHCTLDQEANIHCRFVQHVWHLVRCRSTAWRSFDR
jgi:hypothetical protein